MVEELLLLPLAPNLVPNPKEVSLFSFDDMESEPLSSEWTDDASILEPLDDRCLACVFSMAGKGRTATLRFFSCFC